MSLIKFAALAAVATCSLGEVRAVEPRGRESAQRHGQGEQQRPVSRALPQMSYSSPFADYRPFAEELALKDWRKANDEVREAGGHIGLMKGEPAQAKGHGAHGSKQPTPPAAGERK